MRAAKPLDIFSLALLCGWLAACPSGQDPSDDPDHKQDPSTSLVGLAPMHCGGTLRVERLGTEGFIVETAIDEEGSFDADLGDAHGDLRVTARSGHGKDMLDGLPRDAEGVSVALLPDVSRYTRGEVVLSPWSTLAYLFARNKTNTSTENAAILAAYQEFLDALQKKLNCDKYSPRGILMWGPHTLPDPAKAQALPANSVLGSHPGAHIVWGGWSGAAELLNRTQGLDGIDRINAQTLLGLMRRDFTEGHASAQAHVKPVTLPNGKLLPRDVLTRLLPQGMILFAERHSQPDGSTVDLWRSLLRCGAAQNAPCLGAHAPGLELLAPDLRIDLGQWYEDFTPSVRLICENVRDRPMHFIQMKIGDQVLQGECPASKPSATCVDIQRDVLKKMLSQGDHRITCRGESLWGLQASAEVDLSIPEPRPTRLAGQVSFEGPLRGGRVTAYRHSLTADGDVLEVELGRADVEDGKFSVTLSTNDGGPVLLVYRDIDSDPPAQGDSAGGGAPMKVNSGRLTLLLEGFHPGIHRDGLQVHGLTTLAATLARARLLQAKNIWQPALTRQAQADIIAQAYRDISQAFLGDLKRDLWLVCGQSFWEKPSRADAQETDSSSEDQDGLLVGLFHLGLSRLALETVEQSDQGRVSQRTGFDILQALVSDLADGRFDGRSGRQQTVYLKSTAALPADLLRAHLPGALRRWCWDATLTDQNVQAWQKILRSSRNAVMGTLAQRLADGSGDLFGRRPPVDADATPPALHVLVKDAQGKVRPDLDHQAGVTTFEVVASGSRGIAVISARLEHGHGKLKAGPAQVQTDGDVRRMFFWDSTAADSLTGEEALLVSAQDNFGHRVSKRMQIRFNNVAPVLALDSHMIGNSSTLPLLAQSSKKLESCRVVGSDVGYLCEVDGHRLSLKPRGALQASDSEELLIYVVDEDGKQTEWRPELTADVAAPTIVPVPTPYVQETSGASVMLDPRAQPLIEKDVYRFDFKEDVEHLLARPEIPRFCFRVDDDSLTRTGRSKQQDLQVFYSFVVEALGPRGPARVQSFATEPMRVSWQQPQATELADFCIPLSYQSIMGAPFAQQILTAAKQINWVPYLRPEDTLSLKISVTDAAGNATQGVYPFHLKLSLPPVNVHCAASPIFQKVRLAGKDLEAGRAETPRHFTADAFSMGHIEASWSHDGAASSSAPDDIAVRFSAKPGWDRVTVGDLNVVSDRKVELAVRDGKVYSRKYLNVPGYGKMLLEERHEPLFDGLCKTPGNRFETTWENGGVHREMERAPLKDLEMHYRGPLGALEPMHLFGRLLAFSSVFKKHGTNDARTFHVALNRNVDVEVLRSTTFARDSTGRLLDFQYRNSVAGDHYGIPLYRGSVVSAQCSPNGGIEKAWWHIDAPVFFRELFYHVRLLGIAQAEAEVVQHPDLPHPWVHIEPQCATELSYRYWWDTPVVRLP